MVSTARPPVPTPSEPDERWPNRHADHGRIHEYGYAQCEAQNLDEYEVAENERAEDHDHDGRGEGDDTARAGESLDQRGAIGEPGSAAVGDSGDDEHLVVHAQAEDNTKHDDGQYRKASMHGTRKPHQACPELVLKDDRHGAVGG